MSDIIEYSPILVVDTSTAMLHVLKNFSDKHNYPAECFSDPADACTVLTERFQTFDRDFRCVLLGWPDGKLGMVTDLLGMLGSPDHQDLPLIILSQQPNQDVDTLVKRRPKTRTLLWQDYQQATDLIERLAPAFPPPQSVRPADSMPASAVEADTVPQANGRTRCALLLDDTPSVCLSLRNIMESNGYRVTVASTIKEGKVAVTKEPFDIVITDFFLRGESGEEFCRYLQSCDDELLPTKPVCAVVTSKYSDAIIKRSLAVGATACFYKNESTELLFARIDALVKSRPTSVEVNDPLVSQVLDLTDNPALLLSAEGIVLGLNAEAEALLDEQRSGALTGSRFDRTVSRTVVKADAGNACSALFKVIGKDALPVSFRARKIAAAILSEPTTLVTFSPLPKAVENLNSAVSCSAVPEVAAIQSVAADTRSPVVTRKPLPAEAACEVPAATGPVSAMLQQPCAALGLKHFALLMDIQLSGVTGDRLCLGDSEPMLKLVSDSFHKLYRKADSIAYAGDGQFIFVLATRGIQDALVLTRKLLQVTPQMLKFLDNVSLVSHAAVLNLEYGDDGILMAQESVLGQCRAASARARSDGRDNCALVIPLNQYLTATTAKAVGEKVIEQGNSAEALADTALAPPVKKPGVDKPQETEVAQSAELAEVELA